MTQAQKLIAGLTVLGDAVIGANFYNSGEDAAFDLGRALTPDELHLVQCLDFIDYQERSRPHSPIVGTIYFGPWGPSDT